MSWPFMTLAEPELLTVRVIKGGWISTPFGMPGSWAMGVHPGDDWNADDDLGKPVRAPAAGIVVPGNWGADYGNHVIIQTPDGHRIACCHLQSKAVSVGDRVKAGEMIGRVGNTGRSTGPHVHVEERVRPYRYRRSDVRKPTYDRIPGG